MFTIHLQQLRFHAGHGIHAEETIVGNNFEVSVSVSFPEKARVESLDETVNYVEIHQVIKNAFAHPAKLLETLAQDICHELKKADSRIEKINITIQKLNPPINNFTGTVGVSLHKSY